MLTVDTLTGFIYTLLVAYWSPCSHCGQLESVQLLSFKTYVHLSRAAKTSSAQMSYYKNVSVGVEVISVTPQQPGGTARCSSAGVRLALQPL